MMRWFSFALLIGVILLVGLLFYRVMAGFLLPLFLAAVLVVMFRPVYVWMQPRVGGRRRVAALLTTGLIATAVIGPLGGIATLATLEASTLIANLETPEIMRRLDQLRAKLELEYRHADAVRYLESSLESMQDEAKQGALAVTDAAAPGRLLNAVNQLALELSPEEAQVGEIDQLRQAIADLKTTTDQPSRIGTIEYLARLNEAVDEMHDFKIRLLGGDLRARAKELANPTRDDIEFLTNRAFAGASGLLRSVGGATTSLLMKMLLGLAVLLLAVYFFLADGPAMVESMMRLSPLDDRQERELLDEFDRISRAVVVATLLSAVVQGLLAGVGFYFADMKSVFLLTTMTIVFALIPFFGAATVWVPVSIWLYVSENRPVAAIVMAVYGAGVVSMADNVIKPLVLHGQSNLHPLLAFLSVLGGVQALGPIGILVGPMVVVFLQTLLNILQRELDSMERRRVES